MKRGEAPEDEENLFYEEMLAQHRSGEELLLEEQCVEMGESVARGSGGEAEETTSRIMTSAEKQLLLSSKRIHIQVNRNPPESKQESCRPESAALSAREGPLESKGIYLRDSWASQHS